MDLNPLDIVIHIINIVILFVLLRVLLYKPVAKFLDERAARLAAEKAEAEKLRQAAEAAKTEYESRLAGAEKEAETAARETARRASEEAEQIVTEAREKADSIVLQAREHAQEEKTRALSELRGEVAELAAGMAERIIGREVSLEDNRRIAEEFFSEAGVK